MSVVVQLRPGTAEDISAIQDVEMAARRRYLSIEQLAYVAAAPPIAAERVRYGDLIVAEHNSRLVGFALTNMVDGLLYITNISIDPASSGQGIGAALIKEVQSIATMRGFKAVTLTTFRTPRWNAPWFLGLGFEPMPEQEIGPELQSITQRQARSVDPQTRANFSRPSIGIGGHLAMPPLPHHRAYGSVPRRFGG